MEFYCNKCTKYCTVTEESSIFNIRGYTFCSTCFKNQLAAFPDKIKCWSEWTYKDQLKKEWSDQCKCSNCCEDHDSERCKYCTEDYEE